MENALAALKAFDWGADRNALKPITKAISEAHDNPEALRTIERKLLGVLAGETKGPGKEFICRELGLVGSARALPALERLLLDPETADIARFALERIPDDAASAVLRDALEKTTGLQRIGIINSLGQRQDRGSCKALAALLGDAELPLARAAAEALGRIADKDATRALAAGKDSASAPNRACVLDAYLRCADALLAADKGEKALKIYTELAGDGMPKAIQLAAKQGVLFALRRRALSGGRGRDGLEDLHGTRRRRRMPKAIRLAAKQGVARANGKGA